jgi:rare lipoprotein A
VVDTLITEKKVRVKEVWHGNASYYALAFQGKRTASGERFDSYAFTAAHRTLPFGSMVRVTDMKSGSWVDVRVNDRGPFKHDRIIDISYAAAREIGLVRAGVLRVKVEELE